MERPIKVGLVLGTCAIVAGGLLLWLNRPVDPTLEECVFRGWTAPEWADDLRHWEEQRPVISHMEIQHSWVRQPPYNREERARFGITSREPNKPSLLTGDPAAMPVLVELLKDPSPNTRRMAALGLREIRSRAWPAVPQLLKILNDENPRVKGAAALALLWIDPPTAKRVGIRPVELELLYKLRASRYNSHGPTPP